MSQRGINEAKDAVMTFKRMLLVAVAGPSPELRRMLKQLGPLAEKSRVHPQDILQQGGWHFREFLSQGRFMNYAYVVWACCFALDIMIIRVMPVTPLFTEMFYGLLLMLIAAVCALHMNRLLWFVLSWGVLPEVLYRPILQAYSQYLLEELVMIKNAYLIYQRDFPKLYAQHFPYFLKHSLSFINEIEFRDAKRLSAPLLRRRKEQYEFTRSEVPDIAIKVIEEEMLHIDDDLKLIDRLREILRHHV